jgi:hypothetical protein
MKIALRLLVGVFGLLLLAGCGGGGGGDDGGGASPTIENSFPTLTDANGNSLSSSPIGLLTPSITRRGLMYWQISKNDTDLFEINLQDEGFKWIGASDTYEKNITIGSATYKATAIIMPIPSTKEYAITLKFENLHGDVSVSLFEDIFGHTLGKSSGAELAQTYNGDQLAVFEAYEDKLRNDDFKPYPGNGWQKIDSRGVTYLFTWSIQPAGQSTFSSAAWVINNPN